MITTGLTEQNACLMRCMMIFYTYILEYILGKCMYCTFLNASRVAGALLALTCEFGNHKDFILSYTYFCHFEASVPTAHITSSVEHDNHK